MAGECPTWVSDSAIGMVDDAYGKYSAFAMQSFSNAQQALVALGNYQFNPISFGVSFNLADSLSGYLRPEPPETPEMEAREIDRPPAPPSVDIPDANYSNAPQFGGTIPALVFPAPPSESMPAEPGAAPVLVAPIMPAAPALDYPAVPTLYELDLPDPPAINLPTFNGMRPDVVIPVPLNNFGFQATAYSSDLLDQVGDVISEMLHGGEPLPHSVMQAMRDRAFAASDLDEAIGKQSVLEEYSSRGFAEPSGILNARLRKNRQDAQNRRAALNRDIYIQDQTVAIENRRFAVGQAVALEGQLIQAHHEFMRIGLAVEQATLQAAIDVANVHIAVLNAQLAVYQTDAQVFRELIQAELAKLELYKAELDGQRLRGEINTQLVQIYEQRIRALLARVEIYKAENDAVKTQVDVQTAQVEAYRATVQAYAERVQARTAAFDGYRARVEAEGAKASAAKIVADIYQSRVQGWSVEQESIGRQQQIRLEQKRLELDGWKGEIELSRVLSQNESDRLQNIARVFSTLMEKFRAQASIEQVASDANARQFQLLLGREQARVDTQLKVADVSVNQLVQLSAQEIEILKAIAQVSAQMTAASMSAVNFSAGVSSSRNQSQSCGVSTTYQGSLD